jgi:predicted transposase/invertase (TIGR01784 family)
MEVFPQISAPIQLAHPHDLLTRYFLIDVELFASLLENYGNTGAVRLVDFGSLLSESPISIDDNLQEVIGDLRFSAKFKVGGHSKLFFFFEHQSKKVKRFCLRCLRKLLEFYENCESNPEMLCEDGKYPYVITVLLYHGNIPWNVLFQMGDLVSLPPDADRHFLSFPAIVIDLSLIPQEELKGPPALIALLDALQSASRGKLSENFDRIIGYFKEVKNDPRTYGWLNSLTCYFLAVTETDTETVTGTISKILDKQETEKMVISTLEKFFVQGKTEGKTEGKIEGKIEGKVEGKIEDVLKTLKKRFGNVPESISQSVNSYQDPVVLDSFWELAMDCRTLTEFEQGLVH